MTCDLKNWERPLGGEVLRLTAEHRWVVYSMPLSAKIVIVQRRCESKFSRGRDWDF